MFKLNIANDNFASAFMSTYKLNDSILWHARRGHIYFKRMQDMSKDGLIPAFDMDTEKYKTCMLNKITKKQFQNVKRETKILKLIHSDLFDLHATSSLGNKKYFVTFIDDASRTDKGGEYMDTQLVKPLVLTYESVVMYGLCVYMRYVDYVRVGNQSIERDRLIGIGLVMDLVKFLSFTFGGKEMTFVVLAFLR
ncbi:zinc finger, CCHC-type containing protein [Tanacetum coccineum]